jgi:hypothetical protein
MSRLLDALLWLDIKVLYVGSLGRYTQGETISALAWDMRLRGRWQGKVFVPVIDWLFRPWKVNHCRNAYLWQIEIFKD